MLNPQSFDLVLPLKKKKGQYWFLCVTKLLQSIVKSQISFMLNIQCQDRSWLSIMIDHEKQKHLASLKSNLAQCVLRILDLRLQYSEQITANLRVEPALVTVFLVYCLCLSELCCIDSTICCCAVGRWAGWLIATSKFILLHIKGTCCACRTILVPLNIRIQPFATLNAQTTQINNNIAKEGIYINNIVMRGSWNRPAVSMKIQIKVLFTFYFLYCKTYQQNQI